MLNVRVINARNLSEEHIAAWAGMQESDPTFASPYFRPEFTQAVAAVRNDVEIALLESRGEPVGFFPYQRGRGHVARPVGGRMSDFHGVILGRGATFDPEQLLTACRLSAWHFDHLIVTQPPWRPYYWNVAPSPYLDLSAGWEGYSNHQLAYHRESFKRSLRKLRCTEREAGPSRLDVHTSDPNVFQQLIEWKIAQYRRTGVTNVLGFDWTVQLLDRIRAIQGSGFAGRMSALYLGDMLAAVLLSMQSRDVLHAWFSAYRPEFASLSPGTVLWLQLAQTLPTLGIRRIDLGKGPETYKQLLMSGATDVAEGSFDRRPLARMLRRGVRQGYDWARHSPLRKMLLLPGRMLRRMVESRSFET